MKLTENFALEEFTQSDTALRLGIKNIPSPTIIGNLKTLADGLEQVRKLLGYPLFINSGYRSPELNRAVKGSSTSAHVHGYAADITCRKFGTPDEIVKLLKNSGIKYDQIIAEGTWTHISFDPKMRQETLRALFSGGKVTYKAFI
jgi:zinc D-Ala-D-Ala carboxypeptidase